MKKGAPDFAIFIIVVGLVIFGMLMVFSASYYNNQIDGESGYYFLAKQAIGAGIGLLAMIIISFIDYHILQKGGLAFLLLVASIFLLVLVLFIADETNGAKRWLDLKIFTFQPSEIARLAMIIFTANFLARRSKALRTDIVGDYFKITFPVLFFLILVCALIILEPNLSMMLSVLAVVFCIMVAPGIHTKPLLSMAGIGAATGTLFIFAAEYRMKRLQIFLDPWKDPRDTGYQLVQSLYALGSGGLKGVGLGNSKQKHLYLTYGESDFILSIIGEELGFIGVVILLGIFGFLIYRGIKVAQSAPDAFGLLLGTGIISMVAIQLIIHIAVITSTMPPTGMSLPFVSAGNTSLIMFMASMGVLLNISRQTKDLTHSEHNR
jgi:cell division protein FtsW